MNPSKSDTVIPAASPAQGWPIWARWVVTGVIGFHVAAVLAGALAAPPSSELEHHFAEFFEPYHQAIDQGDSYRYYSTAFPPTPVVTATLTFADGRPEKVVRIPERGLKPRLLYQRQLALAHGLMEDFEAARQSEGGDGSKSRWAHSFATHLGRVNPGCSSVTLRLEMHMVPKIERIKEMLDRPSLGPIDLDSEEFTTAPERIGVFPCDAS
jgi:DNA primase